MAFAYVPMSPDDKKLLEMIFTDEFMQAETNFEAFRDFQSSSAVFTNWKSDIMVYNEEVFDGFVRESTRFTSWDEMVRTAADRAIFRKRRIKRRFASIFSEADLIRLRFSNTRFYDAKRLRNVRYRSA